MSTDPSPHSANMWLQDVTVEIGGRMAPPRVAQEAELSGR